MEKKIFTQDDFKKWGQQGGLKTLKKYGKKRLAQFGKKGGRPKIKP